MVMLHPITSELTAIYKEVRLRALQDMPSAFGSTYAREVQFSDGEWEQRTANLNTGRGIGYLAMDGVRCCGLAACFLDAQDPFRAELVSMWVAPECRREGVGAQLIDAIQTWAMQRSARVLQLMVTSSNHAAIEFYRRNGFAMTGYTEPYPNDKSLTEYQMSKLIA
ncbi:MAG: GNAT family N-acetyltransferase [Acidobacteriota bacterium]|nr:GNAT family N-acetyltransferase [Acidobacteriota bacterium]